MKSFVAYPSPFQKVYVPDTKHKSSSGNILPQVELFKKVQALNGSIVKCGITPAEAFNRFTMLKSLVTNPGQKMIGFEKQNSTSNEENNAAESLLSKITSNAVAIDDVQNALADKASKEQIHFLPGHLDEAIPNYLIEYPELKISYLEIDLDDYEATITALEFFYPRVMHGGVLIIDNYYKQQQEFTAVNDYFASSYVGFHSFSVKDGPHYLLRS